MEATSFLPRTSSPTPLFSPPPASPKSHPLSSTCTLHLSVSSPAAPRRNLMSLNSRRNYRRRPLGSTGRSIGGSSSAAVRLRVTCGVSEIKEGEFCEVVLKSERPVLVEFVADWCGPCRLVAPSIDSIAQDYGERLTVVKIDHDASPKLIEEYKVYGLPTLILFKDGKEVPESRREGAITKAKLKEYIDSFLSSPSVV